MKVRCIDNSGRFSSAPDCLKVGQVYEVVGENGYEGSKTDYHLQGVVPSFRKDRFVKVDDDTPVGYDGLTEKELSGLERRMIHHTEVNDIAVVVLTARELQRLISMARQAIHS